jgi:poly(hydroxyalkanoate) depolymerase family esterase
VSILGFPQRSASLGELRRSKWISGAAHNAFGSRKYKLWVPGACDSTTPSALIVMLHGCTQNAEDLAAVSGMNTLAEREKFLVVYPEQSRRANLLKCWNWFDPAHQSRDAGEPSIIANIVTKVQSSQNIDAARVYVVGISAGGAMAVVLGAAYPDLFAAIGVSAGVQFKAATCKRTAWKVMRHGGSEPNQHGLLAFQAMSAGLKLKRRRRMPLILFQGTNDDRVPLVNADQLIAQWSKTNDCLAEGHSERNGLIEESTQGTVSGGYNFIKHAYKEDGRLLMEKWIVRGLGHAWSGSPVASRYGDPKGPSASEEMWRFFRETSLLWTAQ